MYEKPVLRKKMHRRMFRWSVVFMGITALFLLGSYLIRGPLPIYTGLWIIEGRAIQLPFGIPRWFDIVMAPFFSIVLAWASISCTDFAPLKEDWKFIAVVLTTFAATALWAGVEYFLFDLVIGLIIGLPITLISDPKTGLETCLWCGMGIFLIYWFSLGPAGAWLFCILYGLGVGLGVGLGGFLQSGLGRLKNWLLAKD